MPRRAPLTLSTCGLLGALSCGQSLDAPARLDSGAAAMGASLPFSGASGHDAETNGGSGGTSPAQASMGGSTTTTSSGEACSGAGGQDPGGISLLVFSRTVEYRHESIPAGIQALSALAAAHGWALSATEDAAQFSDAGLADYDAVIFLSTSGDVLDDAEQAAFERFIRAGKGFIGIHSASDTEYDWPWYGGLVGAYFREHPSIQPADIVVLDRENPATAALPNPWRRSDEWYAFQENPRPNVQVLLALDESSYDPGNAGMNGDHPIAWCHEYDGGRAFYTALGHTSASFSEPLFLGQLEGAVAWVRAR